MIKSLITQKEIRDINQKFDKIGKLTADEAALLQVANWSEFQIQSACYNLFKGAGFVDSVIFVQIDNGGSAVEGIRKKKAATGTQSGFCDVIITCWRKHLESRYNSHAKKSIYIEFKRIGCKIAENQHKWHNFLKQKGESVYFCNNILFFERVIMKEIEEFLND